MCPEMFKIIPPTPQNFWSDIKYYHFLWIVEAKNKYVFLHFFYKIG